MKNIVCFVESYYRTPNANGICCQRVAEELSARGNHIHVFASFRGTNQPKKECINGVSINRFYRSVSNRLYMKLKANAVPDSSIPLHMVKFIMRTKSLAMNCLWPLQSLKLVLEYYRAASNLCKSQKVDAVIGVYLHIEEVLAALMIKRKYPNIKCIIYSLDAMGNRVPFEKPDMRNIRKKAIWRWETKALRESDYFCPMQSHKKYFLKNRPDYSAKIKYMDIPLVYIHDEVSSNTVEDKPITNIIYTGTMTKEINNPSYLLQMLPLLDNITFHIYGTLDSTIMKLITESPLYGNKLYFHGRMPANEITQIQANADVLVTFGCDNPNMIPCKIFEYISRKKPILNIFTSEEDPAKPYLLRYPNVIQLSSDAPIDESVNSLKEFLSRCRTIRLDNIDVEKMYWANTPHQMADFILE